MIPDTSLDEEAVRFALMGRGAHAADGLTAELGFCRVEVRWLFKERRDGLEVWFFMPNDPCN